MGATLHLRVWISNNVDHARGAARVARRDADRITEALGTSRPNVAGIEKELDHSLYMLERDMAHLWTVRDRKWVYWRIYPDWESALKDLGLKE